MPIYRRVPKRGFTNARFRTDYTIVNVDQLESLRRRRDGRLDAVISKGLASLETRRSSRCSATARSTEAPDRARPEVLASARPRRSAPPAARSSCSTSRAADERSRSLRSCRRISPPAPARSPRRGSGSSVTLGLLLVLPDRLPDPDPGPQPRVPDQRCRRRGTVFGLISALLRRRDRPDDDLRAGHHALHLGVDHLLDAGQGLAAHRGDRQGRRAGQKKINQWTRLATVPDRAHPGALHLHRGLRAEPARWSSGACAGGHPLVLAMVVSVSLVAGAMLVMWLGELITEYGVGNGSSLDHHGRHHRGACPSASASDPRAEDGLLQTILPLLGDLDRDRPRGRLHPQGRAPHPDPVRAPDPRPARLRRPAALPAAQGQHGRRHADHLRLGDFRDPRRGVRLVRARARSRRSSRIRRLRVRHAVRGR